MLPICLIVAGVVALAVGAWLMKKENSKPATVPKNMVPSYIALVLGLALVGAGGWLWYQNSQKSSSGSVANVQEAFMFF